MGKDTLKLVVAGVVGVALVTAFGLHAADLAKLPKPAAQGFGSVLSTAETGKAPAGG